MMTFDEFMAILQAMDPMQLTLIVALTALLLVLLIVWAIIKGKSSNEGPKRTPDIGAAAYPHGQSRAQGGKLNLEPQTPQPATAPMKAAISPLGQAQAESSRQTAAVQRQHDEIPQDSVLHRHYLANEAAKAAALHEPYPTDSILRRHYDAAHKIVVESLPAVKAVAESSQAAEDIPKAGIVEQAVGKDVGLKVSSKTPGEPMVLARISIPQDSVLRRHFISQLQAEIEANLSPKPSDSVLRRHHDSLVSFELERRLAE